MNEMSYQIKSFMWQKLSLTGGELNVYAIIYSFTQGEGEGYFGSQTILANASGISLSSVKRVLASLLKKGLIKKVRLGGKCSYICVDDIDEIEECGEGSATLVLPTEVISEKGLSLSSELIVEPSKARYSFLPIGRNGILSMTGEQYNALLSLVDEPSLTAYIHKLEDAVLNKGYRVNNPYKTIRKWIYKDVRV